MKKNELVHLHALLARVAADYRARGLMSDADLDPYRDVGVGPSSLTESRAEHRRAVRALLSILADHSDPSAADGDADEADTSEGGEAESEPRSESASGPEPPTGNH